MSADFLVVVAGFVMITVVVGLARILYGPGDADRIMAAQLLGTGGITSLLLVGVARDTPAAVEVALTLAMLAAFASITFVKSVIESRRGEPQRREAGVGESAPQDDLGR